MVHCKGRTIRKVMGGGGIFSLHAFFFFLLTACAGIFFSGEPSARIFFTTCEKVTIGPSFCMNFFYLLLCMDFFSWHFHLHEFFFVFFHTPPPPHHFSNGPSLRNVFSSAQHIPARENEVRERIFHTRFSYYDK